MLIDLSLRVTPEIIKSLHIVEPISAMGHIGTHFDVMDKIFPLEYTQCNGIVFDVSAITDREIQISDINTDLIEPKMFVAFYSNFMQKYAYGSHEYFTQNPQLSKELIEFLCEKHIAIIGVDFAGVRRGKEHRVADQYCADRGVFIVENLCNLQQIIAQSSDNKFKACTYPLNFAKVTGLPCRVVARDK